MHVDDLLASASWLDTETRIASSARPATFSVHTPLFLGSKSLVKTHTKGFNALGGRNHFQALIFRHT